MKNLIAKLKPVIQTASVLVSLLTIYIAVAALAETPALPIPFKAKPEMFSKFLSVATLLLSSLMTWISFHVHIEMFSGPEVAAMGYYETFCQKVARHFGLLPCYIFLPDKLPQLNHVEDFITKIKEKQLNCEYDAKHRIYTITNSSGGKAYLDFPSTLKSLGLVAASEGKFKKSASLERDLISNFKKSLESKLSIIYKKRSRWSKVVEFFKREKTKPERVDAVPFFFINPSTILNESDAGFRKFADAKFDGVGAPGTEKGAR